MGCSERKIYRMIEDGRLSARKDGRGTSWLDEQQVAAYFVEEGRIGAAREPRRAPRRVDGESSSRVFALLAENRSLRDIVRETRVPPDVVRGLAEEWASLGEDAVYLTAGAVKKLAELTSATIRSEADVLVAVGASLKLVCRRCKNERARTEIVCADCHAGVVAEVGRAARAATREIANVETAKEIAAAVRKLEAERVVRRRLEAVDKSHRARVKMLERICREAGVPIAIYRPTEIPVVADEDVEAEPTKTTGPAPSSMPIDPSGKAQIDSLLASLANPGGPAPGAAAPVVDEDLPEDEAP